MRTSLEWCENAAAVDTAVREHLLFELDGRRVWWEWEVCQASAELVRRRRGSAAHQAAVRRLAGLGRLTRADRLRKRELMSWTFALMADMGWSECGCGEPLRDDPVVCPGCGDLRHDPPGVN